MNLFTKRNYNYIHWVTVAVIFGALYLMEDKDNMNTLYVGVIVVATLINLTNLIIDMMRPEEVIS